MSRIWIFILLALSTYSCVDSSSNGTNAYIQIDTTLNDHQNQIITYILRIFCNVRTIFLNILIEEHTPFAFANHIIKSLSHCSASGIILNGYNHLKSQEIDINPYEKYDIGIEMYSVNIVRNPSELNLSYAKKKMKNKEDTRYAIVFTEKLSSTSFRGELDDIFQLFWQRQILNAIVIFWTDRLNCFTYTPFREHFLVELNASETRAERLFYEKSINLMRYKLRLGMFSEPNRADITEVDGKIKMRGIDGGLALMFMKRMNATFQLILPEDSANLGEIFPNKSSNGIFALLQNDKVDMSFNARFYRKSQFRHNMEATITIGRDDLCILVPRSGFALNLDNIFDAFELPVWILAVIALPTYAFFFHVYYGKWRGNTTSHSLSHTFLRLFGWNLNQPYMRSPKTALAKVLLALWIAYSAVITNWYNSNLTSYVIGKPRLPDITTLDQLERSNYHILTVHKYADVMREFPSNLTYYQNLMGRVRSVSEIELYQRISNRDTSFAYANKAHISRFVLGKKNLFDTFVLMTECAVPFLNVYALSYGSPYKGRINWLLSQSQDCGIIDYWLDIRSHLDKLNQARHQKSTSEQHVAISISHLQSAFYILLFGAIISFLVFLYEIYLAKQKCK